MTPRDVHDQARAASSHLIAIGERARDDSDFSAAVAERIATLNSELYTLRRNGVGPLHGVGGGVAGGTR